MKKIPTLFEREFHNHRVVNITPVVPEELKCVLDGECIATVKIDGSCCAIINGDLYKRYDAKKGKCPPEGAIPCGDPDPVTGHWPHWVKTDENNPADRWFIDAYKRSIDHYGALEDGTYEAVGPHFQGNPYQLPFDIIDRHGNVVINLSNFTFECIRDFLNSHSIEGIVFWKDGEPKCKIKRTDFGFKWPTDDAYIYYREYVPNHLYYWTEHSQAPMTRWIL